MYNYLGKPIIALLLCGLLLVFPVPLAAQDARLDNIIVTNTRDHLLLYLTVQDAFPPKIEKTVQSGGTGDVFLYHRSLPGPKYVAG